jgi:hypothetical protein
MSRCKGSEQDLSGKLSLKVILQSPGRFARKVCLLCAAPQEIDYFRRCMAQRWKAK